MLRVASHSTLYDIEAERCARSLRVFVERAWPRVVRAPLLRGWYVDAICDHLEALARGQLASKTLLITIPPRFAKSTICSVLFPVWLWICDPSEQLFTASYGSHLSTRDAVRSRRLLEDEWFQRRWGARFKLRADQNQKAYYENDRMGYRLATSVGGKSTGDGGKRILDDPLKADEAHSQAALDAAATWWREAWSSRVDDDKSWELIIMQRIAGGDIADLVLSEGDCEHLCIRQEYDPRRSVSTSLGDYDTRTEPGQLLCPERFGPDWIARQKVRLGRYAYAAQHDQDPTPSGGGMIKEYWLRFWYDPSDGVPAPERVRDDDGELVECLQKPRPKRWRSMMQSWDCNTKGKSQATRKDADLDFACGLVWGSSGTDYYLLDRKLGRYEYVELKRAVQELSEAWPEATDKLVEDKANGTAIMSDLRDSLGGFIAEEPRGDKAQRLAACSPSFEAGHVYLPHPAQHPWVREYIAELCAGRPPHDDQRDATSQYLNRMRRGGKTRKARPTLAVTSEGRWDAGD